MRVISEAGDLAGKNILLRSDFNVTIKDGKILDDFKIRASLPTIEHLLEQNAKIVLMSSLGRPKGRVAEELRLDPIAGRLTELLSRPVKKINDCIGPDAESAARELKNGETLLLENLRFHIEEEDNDENFAKKLAALGEIYIDDAFGNAHRDDASMDAITKILPSYAGFLLQKEVEVLSRVKDDPERPLTVIIGGAKISTKIKLIQEYLQKADHVILGGALANTVLRAQGIAVGSSFIEEEAIEAVKGFELTNVKLHMPVDVVVNADKNGKAATRIEPVGKIGPGEMILDIGPETENIFGSVIKASKMILWNGPMGFFEVEKFTHGTRAVAEAIANCPDCFSVAGGGETVCFIENSGLIDKFSHVSTGGGAMLEFLAGDKLPGIEALK